MARCVAPHGEDLPEVGSIDLAVEVDVGGGVVAGVGGARGKPRTIAVNRGSATTGGQIQSDPLHLNTPVGPCAPNIIGVALIIRGSSIPNNRRLRRNLRRRCRDDSRNVRRTGFGSWHHAVDDWVRGEAKSKYA